MKEQNIEQLFKNSFSNFEADVNANAWANISQALQTPVPGQQPLNGSPAGKSAGMLGRMNAGRVISYLAITAAVIGTIIYFNSNNSVTENDVVKNDPVVVKENPAVVASSVEPAAINNAEPAAVKNIPAGKFASANPSSGGQITNQNFGAKSSGPKTATPVFVQPKEKERVSENESDHITAAENTRDIDKKSEANHSVAEREYSPADNSAEIKNHPQDNNAVVVIPPSVVAESEPAYSDIISITETESNEFKFFVPNAFSPNSDEVNESFTPMGTNFKEYELIIFDRQGKEIFKSKDINNKWDGKLRNGKPAPEDVYGYLINVKDMNNINHPYSGSINLKR